MSKLSTRLSVKRAARSVSGHRPRFRARTPHSTRINSVRIRAQEIVPHFHEGEFSDATYTFTQLTPAILSRIAHRVESGCGILSLLGGEAGNSWKR